jgi:hypothetical protein
MRKDILKKKWVTVYSVKQERRFFFFFTLLMVILGILFRWGIFI